MNKKDVLVELGFSDRESIVYLCLLELGQSTAFQLAKKIDVLRPTMYNVLDSLIRKGFVTYNLSSGKKIFAPVRPKVLQEILLTKQQHLKEILPDLENLSKVSTVNPNVETFIGVEGVKNIYEDMISSRQDVFHIYNYRNYLQIFQMYFIHNWVKKRLEKKFWFRAIIDKVQDSTIDKTNKKEQREVRILKNMNKLKPAIFFYGDKCGFIALEQTPIGIVIENKTIASSFKFFFDILWHQAKKT